MTSCLVSCTLLKLGLLYKEIVCSFLQKIKKNYLPLKVSIFPFTNVCCQICILIFSRFRTCCGIGVFLFVSFKYYFWLSIHNLMPATTAIKAFNIFAVFSGVSAVRRPRHMPDFKLIWRSMKRRKWSKLASLGQKTSILQLFSVVLFARVYCSEGSFLLYFVRFRWFCYAMNMCMCNRFSWLLTFRERI